MSRQRVICSGLGGAFLCKAIAGAALGVHMLAVRLIGDLVVVTPLVMFSAAFLAMRRRPAFDPVELGGRELEGVAVTTLAFRRRLLVSVDGHGNSVVSERSEPQGGCCQPMRNTGRGTCSRVRVEALSSPVEALRDMGEEKEGAGSPEAPTGRLRAIASQEAWSSSESSRTLRLSWNSGRTQASMDLLTR